MFSDVMILDVLLRARVSRFLNIKLDNITVLDEERHPHMVRHGPRILSPLPIFCSSRPSCLVLVLEGLIAVDDGYRWQ